MNSNPAIRMATVRRRCAMRRSGLVMLESVAGSAFHADREIRTLCAYRIFGLIQKVSVAQWFA